MSLPLGAWKLVTWAVGLTGAALYAFIEKDTASTLQIVIIACIIAAVPPTVTGIFQIVLQTRANRKLHEVSEHINGMMAKAQASQQEAMTRADRAEAFTQGSDSERVKEK